MIFGAMHKLTGGSKWFNLVATGSVASTAVDMNNGHSHSFLVEEPRVPTLSSESMVPIECSKKKRNEAFYSSSLELNEDTMPMSSNYIPASNAVSPHYHTIVPTKAPSSHDGQLLESHIASQLEYLDMIAGAEPTKKGAKDRIRYLISLFQLSQQALLNKKGDGAGASFQAKKERRVSKSAMVSSVPAAVVPDMEHMTATPSDLLTSSLEMSKADIIKSSSLLLSPEPQYIHVDRFPAVFPADSKQRGILKSSSCTLKPAAAAASLTLASPDASSFCSGSSRSSSCSRRADCEDGGRASRSCHSSPSSYGSCQELPRGALLERRVVFNKVVLVGDAISPSDYERKGEYIAKSLTPEVAYFIKKELNQVKSEMHVHENSRCHTQFYVI